FRAVDAGEGWLIFALPPGEMGIHPGGGDFVQAHADHSMLGAVLYLMCDDLPAFIRTLEGRGVRCTEITEAGGGVKTPLRFPSGGEIGLYQPTHPVAIGLK